jgi:transitional endoplasmic reticulum ATPase
MEQHPFGASIPNRSKSSGYFRGISIISLTFKIVSLSPPSRKNVIVIGATNCPGALDLALHRPGRFDREIELRVPSTEGRLEIFHIHTRGMPLTEDVNFMDLAQITYGFVGPDIAALCREVAMRALRRVLPRINLKEPHIPK